MKNQFRLIAGIFAVALMGWVGNGCSVGSSAVDGGVTSGSGSTNGGSTTGGSSTGSGNACTLMDDTTATATVNAYGCALRTIDATSCESARTAQGLSGFWLKFSCNVTLTKSGSGPSATVTLESNGYPDYQSEYFDSGDACYESFTASGRHANPNLIEDHDYVMTVPYAPTTLSSPVAMPLGVVGMAVNGVVIYSNVAAPGDDIFDEASTFDSCEGHPDQVGAYHYHVEPPAISNGDDNFIGVMRDGFPIYGRYDSGSVTPSLDSAGGHTGTTPDSGGSSVYHYHVNLQTDADDPGVSEYFITSGYYNGTAGTCTGCH